MEVKNIMDMVNFETLALISILTTLTTECIKTLMNKAEINYVSNIIAAITAVVISSVVCIAYPVIMQGAVINSQLIFKAFVMAFFGILCSTLSFDKVIQTLKKLKE